MQRSSIFRPAALRRYRGRRERTVLPMLAAPRVAACLCILSAILGAGLAAAAVIELPSYTTGFAVSAGRAGAETGGPGGGDLLPLLLPAESLPRLRVGQKVFIRQGEGRELLRLKVEAVLPEAMSQEELRTRLKFEAAPRTPLAGRVAVAFAGPVEVGAKPPSQPPGVYEASVETGTVVLFAAGRNDPAAYDTQSGRFGP